MLTLIGVWTGRRHIWNVLKRTLSDKSGVDDSMEPLPYRFAVFGLLGGLIFLLIYCQMRVSGLFWEGHQKMVYPKVLILIAMIFSS